MKTIKVDKVVLYYMDRVDLTGTYTGSICIKEWHLK